MTNLAQINIDSTAFGKWAGRRNIRDEDTSVHALIGELFGRGVFQPFRYREFGNGRGIFNGYTAADARELQDMVEMTANPDTAGMIQGDILTRAMYIPRQEQRVGFEIKVTPMIRRGPGRNEQDVYNRDRNMGKDIDRETSYSSWLKKRLEPACSVETIRLIRHSQYASRRKSNKMTACMATFQGTLTVRDVEAFEKLLLGGIGRQKAYGYGMLNLTAPDPI